MKPDEITGPRALTTNVKPCKQKIEIQNMQKKKVFIKIVCENLKKKH